VRGGPCVEHGVIEGGRGQTNRSGRLRQKRSCRRVREIWEVDRVITIPIARQGVWQWVEDSRLPDEPLSV
jgi:hypothetical protein